MVPGIGGLLVGKVKQGLAEMDGGMGSVLIKGFGASLDGNIRRLQVCKAKICGNAGGGVLDGRGEGILCGSGFARFGKEAGQFLVSGCMGGVQVKGSFKAFSGLGIEASVNEVSRFVIATSTAEMESKLEVSLDMRGIKVDGGLQIEASFSEILGTVMKETEAVMGVSVVRIEAGGFFEMIEGIVGVAQLQGEKAEVVVGPGVSGIDFDGLFIMPAGF